MTTAVANAGPAGGNTPAPVANSQGATPQNMNPGEVSQGSVPPTVVNTPPAQQAPAKTPEQLQAEQDAANQNRGKPQVTPEQEAAAAEAARAATMDIDFVQGNPQEVAVVNAAVQLMRDAGMKKGDANKVFGKAFETGDLKDIDRAALVEKVGEQKAALILAGVMEYNNTTGSARMAAAKSVIEVMGSKENWATVRTWARALEKADPEWAAELDEYRKMIDIGGRSAKYAAEQIRKRYEGDPKNSSLSRTVVQGDGTVARIENPITSRAQYVEELKKAHAKGDMNAVRQINARRAAGRASR